MVIFQILTLLLAGLVFLIALVLIAVRKRLRGESGVVHNPWPYFLAFVILGGTAIFSVKNYIYPQTSVFDNTKYHILEDKGIYFTGRLSLVQSDSTNNSLWDHKSGQVILQRTGDHLQFSLRDFFEPFYLSQGDSMKLRLQNAIITCDVSKGIIIRDKGRLLFELKILNKRATWLEKHLGHQADSSFYLLRTADNAKFDTSTFRQEINKNYPLMSIIERTPSIKVSEDLQLLLEGALLLRTEITATDPNSDETIYEAASPLVFFPKSGFFYSRTITVNGQGIESPHKQFTVKAGDKDRFYSGTGAAKTEVFKINLHGDNDVSLSFLLPKMYRLKNDDKDNRLFMTSSIDEVQLSDLKGGYFFDNFDSVRNVNHINAVLRYRVGSPRQRMYFSIKDIYADSNEPVICPEDSVFFLKTKNTGNQLKWMFQFRNLRETNRLKIDHISFFIMIFIALVALRFYFDKKRLAVSLTKFRLFYTLEHLAKLSLIEIGIYVLIFCLCVFRLILAWRMSTFVPIDDIGLSRFNDVRDGYYVYFFTLKVCAGTFLLIFFCNFVFNHRREHYKEYRRAKWPERKIIWTFVVFLFGLILFTAFAQGNHWYSRIINIPLPVFFYFIFDFWLISANRNPERPDVTPKRLKAVYGPLDRNYSRVLLWMIAFLYFAIQDSGFSVIFLVYGLLHHLFSRFLFSSTLSKKRALTYIFLLTFIFCLFLRYESQLIIWAFTLTLRCLCILSAICLISAFVIGTNPYFKRKTRRIIGFVLVGLALLGPIFSSKVAGYLNVHKSYIKYRSEIQLPGMTMEKMIKGNGQRSSDMAYILRSAHNQWFINLYDSVKHSGYFELQPHFNQGSTFTTQTTDLVIPRYVISEHPSMILIVLMGMLVALPVIYSLGAAGKKIQFDFTIVGGFILIYSIAYFVCLSATNRVVFFGQDFPFLSIMSQIAVGFPILIFLIAILGSWYKHYSEGAYIDNLFYNKLWFIFTIIFASLAGYLLLVFTEKVNHPNDFDIANVLQQTSKKVGSINDEFVDYQLAHPGSLKGQTVDKILDQFCNSDSSRMWNQVLKDPTDKFDASILSDFKNYKNKWDPDNLLHVQIRNGIYSIVVNRRYYFLKSFRDSVNWRGNLLAAQSDKPVGLVDKYGNQQIADSVVNEKDFSTNILPSISDDRLFQRFKNQLNNIVIMRLDSTWTNLHEPIYLIKSGLGAYSENQASFSIFNDTLTINNASKRNKVQTSPLLAFRILKSDLVSLNIKDGNKYRTVLQLNLVNNNERFLAKNLWLNGRRNLFYPLGREFIWSYSFSNLINATFDSLQNKKFLDSTIRISIDYDLTKQLYTIIDNANKPKCGFNIREDIKHKLIMFGDLDDNQLKIQSNGTGMYLIGDHLQPDPYNMKDQELVRVVNYINQVYNPRSRNQQSNNIKAVVRQIVNKSFDYSAVVLDGFGRIRSLFDYNRYGKVDPNNVKDFNKFISDSYKQNSSGAGNDLLGDKAISVIPSGPGSSFKPIAYTSAASQVNFGWENLSIDESSILNGTVPSPKKEDKNGSDRDVLSYGGRSLLTKGEKKWTVESPTVDITGSDYLIHSNNLFHSLVIFLGSQNEPTLTAIHQGNYSSLFHVLNAPGSQNAIDVFPVIRYNNKYLAIDSSKWPLQQNTSYFGNTSSVLSNGLSNNFRLKINSLEYLNQSYENLFGEDTIFSILYEKGRKNNFFAWSFPELSSFNQLDRTVTPRIRNGLIQPSLGAFPIRVSPLQMAAMGLRLATLNRANTITTLSPQAPANKKYAFFSLGTGWDTTKFLKFYSNVIFNQLDKVITGSTGTAQMLQPVRTHNPQYYFYAKTGTLNLSTDNRREKHLLVIISNKKLDGDKPPTVDDLRNMRVYVVYMSYHNINKDDYKDEAGFNSFIFQNYSKVINAVTSSSLFLNYMHSGR